MSSPEAEPSDDETARLTPTERAILKERLANFDEDELLTVAELRSRFNS